MVQDVQISAIDRYDVIARSMNQATSYSDTASTLQYPFFYKLFRSESPSIVLDQYRLNLLDIGELKKMGVSIVDEENVISFLQKEELDPKILLLGARLLSSLLNSESSVVLKVIDFHEEGDDTLYFEIRTNLSPTDAKSLRQQLDKEWIEKVVMRRARKVNYYLRTV